MRENSRVPPSRHSPDHAGRPGDQVPTAASAPEGPSQETAGPATASQSGPDESAGLPRRVRGSNGLRPPVQVERPTFSDSMLERVRAAVAAETNGEPDEPAPPPEPAGDANLLASAGPASATAEPVQESSAEMAAQPVRPLGAKGAGKPLETVASSFLLRGPDELAGAPEETTQPIPAITRGLHKKGTIIELPGERKTENIAAPPLTQAPPGAPSKMPQIGPRKTGTGRVYRLAGLLAIALLAIGAGALVFMHYGHRPAASAAISSADLPLTTRNSAAAWVAGQVAAGDVVACDPVMCRSLERRGVPSTRLRVLWPGSDSLTGAVVVVATPAVQSHLGAQLSTVAAPGVIARFGAGNRQIVIRVMAPHGAAAYRSALAADLSERKSSGQVLVSNSAMHWSAAEQKQLAAGQVDVRLMVAIVDLAAAHPVQVVAFGDRSPGAPGAPLRSAELAYSGSAAKKALLAGLATVASGSPEYRPSHITPTRLRTGQTVLLVEFSAPSPLGLLGGGS